MLAVFRLKLCHQLLQHHRILVITLTSSLSILMLPVLVLLIRFLFLPVDLLLSLSHVVLYFDRQFHRRVVLRPLHLVKQNSLPVLYPVTTVLILLLFVMSNHLLRDMLVSRLLLQ